MLFFLFLLSTVQGTRHPVPLLIVNTPFRPTPSGSIWRLKIRLYPERSETYQGADIPTLYGRVVFEVQRPGQKPRLTSFETFNSYEFGATGHPFVPTFQDFDHDGRLDFTLCHRVSIYSSKCHIFSIDPDGQVLLIGGFGLDGPTASTSPMLESTRDGFCIPAPNVEGRVCYRWNPEWSGPETGHFEPLLPADRGPAN